MNSEIIRRGVDLRVTFGVLDSWDGVSFGSLYMCIACRFDFYVFVVKQKTAYEI